jgi:hypothetical protein
MGFATLLNPNLGECDCRTGKPAPRQNRRPLVQEAGGLLYCYLVLCLNDARRDEEDQLLVGSADRAPLEQVAEHRDVTQQRHL